jgi:hypothetical protein
MERAYRFESADDFNTRVLQNLESINTETRKELITEAAQTLFSAVAIEKDAVEQYALKKVKTKGAPTKLTHYIEWGRQKNEFIPDDTVSCKLAQQKNKDGMGEGIIYEILFPLNGSVISADYLLENFISLVNKNEFYIVKTNTEDESVASYFYINETGIAEHQPCGTNKQEIDIELAVFMEQKDNIPMPILTAEREMRLLANLIEMKLVPYKKSSL